MHAITIYTFSATLRADNEARIAREQLEANTRINEVGGGVIKLLYDNILRWILEMRDCVGGGGGWVYVCFNFLEECSLHLSHVL